MESAKCKIFPHLVTYAHRNTTIPYMCIYMITCIEHHSTHEKELEKEKERKKEDVHEHRTHTSTATPFPPTRNNLESLHMFTNSLNGLEVISL